MLSWSLHGILFAFNLFVSYFFFQKNILLLKMSIWIEPCIHSYLWLCAATWNNRISGLSVLKDHKHILQKKMTRRFFLPFFRGAINTKIREFRNNLIRSVEYLSAKTNRDHPNDGANESRAYLLVCRERKKSSQFIFIFIFINIYRSLANFYTHNLELGVFTQIASVFGQFRPFGLRFSPLNEWFKWSVSFTYFNGDIFLTVILLICRVL